MLEKIVVYGEMILNFIKALPLTDLLVGVVVPIVAVWISYYLAERAIRKKENNRLYIQLELIRKELRINDKALNDYITSVDEAKRLKENLEFPLIFMKDFLVNILDKLQVIKSNYMYSAPLVMEYPTDVYLWAQKIDDLDNNISEEEGKYYSDKYLDEKRQEKIWKLKEEKEQYVEKLKAIKDKNIYNEFIGLQMELERLMIGDIFGKCDEKGENFDLAKYIYEKIKTFNEKPDKTKDDVWMLFKELVIFEISSDIIKDGEFDQETFDLYYKTFENPKDTQAKLYALCEKYYKWIALKDRIKNHEFNFENKRWNENSADFVIINDRDLYISLVELYENLDNEIVDEEKYNYALKHHSEIQNIMNELEQHDLEIKKKC